MKRFILIIISICIFLSNTCSVLAYSPEEPIVMPRYQYIQTYTTTIILDEDTGIATIKAYCTVASGYTVDVECSLQQFVATNWTTIRSWSMSGSRYGSIVKNYALYSGYTYRAYATFRVRDASGNIVETETDSYICVYPSKN